MLIIHTKGRTWQYTFSFSLTQASSSIDSCATATPQTDSNPTLASMGIYAACMWTPAWQSEMVVVVVVVMRMMIMLCELKTPLKWNS